MRPTPLLLLLPLVGGGFAAALEAWRSGDWEGARVGFQAAILAAGDRAGPELHYDLALVCARLERWPEMEEAAARMVSTGGEAFAGRRSFLRGLAAWHRAHEAAGRAELAGTPVAWDRAVLLAEAARLAWEDAVRSRLEDWPEARRNAERAADLVAEYRRRRQAAAVAAGDEPPAQPPPLDSSGRRQLFDRLELLDRRKLEERRRRRSRTGPPVERDW
ncbi:MAG: hypothetical protein D6702_01355 [Planctomycetota bacterium]|nr:MAG: hypothetical protein D6702_01355 [Planctomycetota bacterium]